MFPAPKGVRACNCALQLFFWAVTQVFCPFYRPVWKVAGSYSLGGGESLFYLCTLALFISPAHQVEVMTDSVCATTVHAIRDTELACLPAGLLNTIKLKQPQVCGAVA